MVRLRSFGWQDLDGLLAVRHATAGLEAGHVPATRAALEAYWRAEGVQAERDLWVVEGEDGILAYGGLRPAHSPGWLQLEIAVLPRYQGRGLGGRLLTRLMSEAIRRRAAYVMAVADDGEPRAGEFLRRAGLTPFVPRQHMRLQPVVAPAAQETPGYVVRRSGPSESGALARVNNAAYAVDGRGGDADAEGYRQFLEESGTQVWVAARLSDGEIVGLCEARRREVMLDGRPTESGHIGSLAVIPAEQGRGLGRRLLAAGIEFCRETGCPSVELNVDRDNEAAVHLYTDCGFTVTYAYTLYRLALFGQES